MGEIWDFICAGTLGISAAAVTFLSLTREPYAAAAAFLLLVFNAGILFLAAKRQVC